MPVSTPADTTPPDVWPKPGAKNYGSWEGVWGLNRSVVIEIYNDTEFDLSRITIQTENAQYQVWPAEVLKSKHSTSCVIRCPGSKFDIKGWLGYAIVGEGNEAFAIWFKNPKLGDNEIDPGTRGKFAGKYYIGAFERGSDRNNPRWAVWISKKWFIKSKL